MRNPPPTHREVILAWTLVLIVLVITWRIAVHNPPTADRAAEFPAAGGGGAVQEVADG